MDNSKFVDEIRKIEEEAKFLGTVNLEGEQRKVFLELEREVDEQGNFYDIEKFYIENLEGELEFVAGNNPNDGLPLTLSQKYQGNDNLLEQLENLEENIKGAMERLNERAKQMGLNKDDIVSLEEVDPNQEIEEEEKEPQEQEEEPKELTKEQTEQLVIKEKTKANQFVKGESLTQKMGINKLDEVKGKSVVSIARAVTRGGEDKIVAVLNDGSSIDLEKAGILKKDASMGTSKAQQHATIESEDGKISLEAATSRYQINGRSGEFLEFGWDQDRSGKEIKYTMDSHENEEGRGKISIELKNSNISIAESHDVRKYLLENINGQGEHGAFHMKEKIREEARIHGVSKEDDDNIKNDGKHYNDRDKIAGGVGINQVDSNKSNDRGHVHNNDEEIEYEVHDHIPPGEMPYYRQH